MLSVTIKILFSNPAQLFLLLFKKGEKYKKAFLMQRGRKQQGPGLMVTKRPKGVPSFQLPGLGVFQAMGKHYGLSAAKSVNLIKEATLQRLTVVLRIES